MAKKIVPKFDGICTSPGDYSPGDWSTLFLEDQSIIYLLTICEKHISDRIIGKKHIGGQMISKKHASDWMIGKKTHQ